MNQEVACTESVTTSHRSASRIVNSYSIRNGLLCAFVVGACLLATYPAAELGFVDDWSYARSALDFVHTGHFVYNGWATAMLGWQILWGALFIKLFGFSFTVVRLSMLPIAMASIYLFHQILLRFGIVPRLAAFGALTLGLSPLFVPLAVSFMTDVPGLFVILLCVYMCQRAVASSSGRSALLWLCSAALLNVGGGTVRQIAWLGALVMVPSTAWLLRRSRGMIPAAILLGGTSFVAVLACLHWFNQQPFAGSEAGAVSGSIQATMPLHLAFMLLKEFLCLLLILLPVLIAWLPFVWKLSSKARFCFAASMAVVLALSVFRGIHGPAMSIHGPRDDDMMPWIGHIIFAQIVQAGYMLGSPAVTLGVWTRLAISVIAAAAGIAFAVQLFDKRRGPKSNPAGCQDSWQEVAWILGPFALAYFCLLSPRGAHGMIFDRYLLAPAAVSIVVLLKLLQQERKTKPAAISWLVFTVFALYTLAATHDCYALYRARVLAANQVQQSGVPRTSIQGGFEYDGWTQVESAGYINASYIRVPKGAYNPNVPQIAAPPDCRLPYASLWSAVRPKYFLVFQPTDCLAPSKYPAIGYRTWLPPYDRKVYVQQLPNSSLGTVSKAPSRK